MGKHPTKKQKEILDFVTEFIQQHEYAPSYREIAEHFGLSSTATIHEHIKELEDKGYLRMSDREARSLEIVGRPRFKKAIELPLVGTIAAGQPIEAVQEAETISVPVELVKDAINSFVLKVRGDSMIDDGIFDGDYVIAERNYYPRNGDVVVALLNESDATLKRYYREKARVRLQPANSSMKPIYTKNPVIQGIVKAIIRKFSTI